MRAIVRFLACLMACLCATGPALAQSTAAVTPVTVIHAGALLATPGEAPLVAQTIVIRDGRVQAIEPGYLPASQFGPDARLVDLSRQFVLPGLIDLHMHLAIIMDADQATVASPARLALAVAGYAQRLLDAGVTTVRDVGDNTGVTFAVRDAIANGDLPGPRVIAAGRIISGTGGHGAKQAAPGEIPYVPAGCDGLESCRRAVRENVEQGSDWIKVTVSGSGREVGGRRDAEATMFPDELRAVVEAARQRNRPVAAHAHSTRAINLALEAGVCTIEHGTYFDDRSVALFKRTGAFLVPTAFVADFVRSRLDQFAGGQDGQSREALKAWADTATAAPGRAWRAGVRLGLGTDSGPSFDPDATAREVGLYVASGVPSAAALRAATSNGAEALGMGDSLGRIRPGFLADLIAVDGNPLDDVARLRSVVFVMKDGVIRKSP